MAWCIVSEEARLHLVSESLTEIISSYYPLNRGVPYLASWHALTTKPLHGKNVNKPVFLHSEPIFHEMPFKNEVIDDPTDSDGTLRPNLSSKPTIETHFSPLRCPEFSFHINLPPDVDMRD